MIRNNATTRLRINLILFAGSMLLGTIGFSLVEGYSLTIRTNPFNREASATVH